MPTLMTTPTPPAEDSAIHHDVVVPVPTAVPSDLVPMYVVQASKQDHIKMLKETFVWYAKVCHVASPAASADEPTLQMLSKWATELNKFRTGMGNSGKTVAELKLVKEAREKYQCKLGQQPVLSMGDFLQYLAGEENWSESHYKKTQEMLYDLKYGIWANKEAAWLLEGENGWLSCHNWCYDGKKNSTRQVSSYCKLLMRKKEEIVGRLEAREVKLSGMVVRRKK